MERLRLFLIIVLGEAVLTTGTAIAKASIRPLTIVAGVVGMAVVVTFWAAYFVRSDQDVTEHLKSTPDPIRAARLGLNGGYLVLAALVALAVGNELVIAHPAGDGSPALSLLLFGGTFAYVAAQAWYLASTVGYVSRARWVACAALVVGGTVAAVLPRLAALGLLLLITCGLNWRLMRSSTRT